MNWRPGSSQILVAAVAAGALLAAAGCGSSSSDSSGTDATGGDTGTGGSPATGGDTAAAGSPATGGDTAAGGAAGSPAAYWDTAYVPAQLPTPADGNHNADVGCMGCHATNDAVWLFAGTVHQQDGTTGAASVEVGVRDGANLYTAYSATNGNFWFPDNGGTIDWAAADVRMRNANGEAHMTSTASASCNQCHTGGMALVEP
jgi:hypothetical protein